MTPPQLGRPLVRLGKRLLQCAVLLLSALCQATEAPDTPQAPALQWSRADAAAAEGAMPPADGWQEQALPDEWRFTRPGFSGQVWYRVRFDLPATPAEAMALLVPRVAVTGRFHLNGLVLNPQVRFTPADGPVGTQMTNQPQYLVLPQGLLRAGPNELLVQVQGDAVTGGGLSRLSVGPADALWRAWLWKQVPQRVVPAAMLVLLLATLVVGTPLAWRDRHGPTRNFLLVTGLWTVLTSWYLWPEVPLTRHGLALSLSATAMLLQWALLRLCWRVSGSGWAWFPRLVDVTSVVTLAGVAALALGLGPMTAAGALLLPSLVLRALTTAMLLQRAWRARTRQTVLLAAAEGVWFAGTLQFIAIVLRWLPPEPFMLTPSDALPLYLVVLYLTVERLVRERDDAARSRQQALDAERQRILHDMHDGMGAQLITALRVAERPGADQRLVARGIQDALADLRLIIDSLGLTGQDLLPLLGNLRYRLQAPLQAAGIQLGWTVHRTEALRGLSPPAALGVLRIVQEALHNALRHSGCHNVQVELDIGTDGARIDVVDDGRGFDPQATSTGGRGLDGMRLRAQRLGADLQVQAAPGGGTRVTLRVPARPDGSAPSEPGPATAT